MRAWCVGYLGGHLRELAGSEPRLHLCELVAHAVELGAGRRTLAVGARLGLGFRVIDVLRLVARGSVSLGKKFPIRHIDAVDAVL